MTETHPNGRRPAAGLALIGAALTGAMIGLLFGLVFAPAAHAAEQQQPKEYAHANQ